MKGVILERCEITVGFLQTSESFVLQKAIRDAGICPFSPKSVSQHQRKMLRRYTPFGSKVTIARMCLCRICWEAVFLWCYLTSGFSLAFGSSAIPMFWNVVPIVFSVAALLCCPVSTARRPWVGWNIVFLETYLKDYKYPLLPGEVYGIVKDLRERCPEAVFTIWVFEVGNTSIEGLLHVRCGSVGYLIAGWEE